MNNCRAGLYSFASTTAWLREVGMASPPFLVVLSLMLPDSRILTGVASIGLTLPNVAIILPCLRQAVLDSLHSSEGPFTNMQSKADPPLVESNATQPAPIEMVVPALPSDGEYQDIPLTDRATAKSACFVSLECLDVTLEVTLQPARKTDNVHILCHTPHVYSSQEPIVSLNQLTWQGRDALQIPLPVPDAAEIAFFDTTDILPLDLEETFVVDQETDIEEDSMSEDDDLMPTQGTAILPSTLGYAKTGENVIDAAMPVGDENVSPLTTNVATRGHDHAMTDFAAHLPARRTDHEGDLVDEQVALAKRRPESLDFIPQSVIRRYPSAAIVPAGCCFGYPATSSVRVYQLTPGSLPGGATPQVSSAASEGHWRPEFPMEAQASKQSLEGQQPVEETTLVHELGAQSLLEHPTSHATTPLAKKPTQKRRLGVLARAALRRRKSAARQCRSCEIDDSSSSESSSDGDSDSLSSSGSSDDESMLPHCHMLGADLIAAIDANSESGLNLGGPRRVSSPSDAYEDVLVSEDSVGDVSLIMHMSSNDDASDGDVKAPVTVRPVRYEDIQQWATGVVQKYARQVCGSRGPVEPLSPSQASDVCAERPLGSGKSQCPLSGLHCKLGGTALGQMPTSVPIPIPPTRQPLSIRSVRDIPEFVPNQRYAAMIMGRVEGLQGTAMDDAAAQVITRVENRTGLNTGQWLVGTNGARNANGRRGRQGGLRRA